MKKQFRLGLMINPLAGLGGSVALKGSDGIATEALKRGAEPKAHLRMQQALSVLSDYKECITLVTASGVMGEDLAKQMGFDCEVVYQTSMPQTSAKDSKSLVAELIEQKLDLLLFAGGDGTARDVFSVVGESMPVLGVPAGVKIHSGVYGVTPHAAGLVVKMLLEGELVSLMSADVMDIDEVAFRQGTVRAKRYGEMLVPAEPRYVQAVKMGGKESDELVLADIAAEVIENMDDELFIMGSGSTVAAVMEELTLDNTLLGVDLIQEQGLIAQDVTAKQLAEYIRRAQEHQQVVKLVITLIGGQGHILGRGNQQLSPEVIRLVGKENILLVATKTKLKALEGRPLIVDSGDEALDHDLSGYYQVITGYHDYVMYQVADFA